MRGALFRLIVLTFHIFSAFKRTVQQIDPSTFYYVIRFMFFWVIIGVNRGLIIQFTRFRVYVLPFITSV